MTLKRKLYGTDKEHPAPFVSPRPVEGKPATVLHEGTLEEAGIKPDALKKLDTLLEEWAADSDEAIRGVPGAPRRDRAAQGIRHARRHAA